MNYFAIIDCGTTNTRIYLVDRNYQLIKKDSRKIGVLDTVLSGTRDILRIALKKFIEETVLSAGLSIKDISFAITSGMITSEIGLLEIPHLLAPVSIDDLASNIKIVQDHKIFPLNIPLYFIRGIKNHFQEETNYKNIRKFDFMRGEETQVAGLLSIHSELKLPIILTMLSSHTKYIYINENKQICGSLTTISGQIYEAIKKETFIGKSIKQPRNEQMDEYFNEHIINIAYDSVMNAGFLRALMMPRFMEILIKTKWYERELFINSAIASEDLKVIKDFSLLNIVPFNSNFILVGHKLRCKILSYMLKRYFGVKNKIKMIFEMKDIEQLSIEGSISIAKKAGYLSRSS